MDEYFADKLTEIQDTEDTAYLLENNEIFYDVGYKVMQNQENANLLREEIHRIVAHADHQVEDREQKEEQDDSEVDSFHDLFQLVAQRCPPGVSDCFPGC